MTCAHSSTDPIDDASFQVWVDGAERTSRFRIGNGEAWGMLAAASNTSGPDSTSRANATRGAIASANAKAQLTTGAHLVTARVCSVRGVCNTSRDILVAVPVTSTVEDITTNVAGTSRTAARRRHSHLKQPWTLVGDLVTNVAKVLRP